MGEELTTEDWIIKNNNIVFINNNTNILKRNRDIIEGEKDNFSLLGQGEYDKLATEVDNPEQYFEDDFEGDIETIMFKLIGDKYAIMTFSHDIDGDMPSITLGALGSVSPEKLGVVIDDNE